MEPPKSQSEILNLIACSTSKSAAITGVTAKLCELKPGMIFVSTREDANETSKTVEAATRSEAAAVIIKKSAKLVALEHKKIPIIEVPEPRLALAELAAYFTADQPATIVAITGTTGKTSVAEFTRQLFVLADLSAASIGTLGIIHNNETRPADLTTPDPVSLHKTLAELSKRGVTHLAIEASSHGLSQYRLDGVNLTAACFTNLSQDHQDYHKDMQSYFDTKMRLFGELLSEKAPAGVINVDTYWGKRAAEYVKQCGLELISVGTKGTDLKLVQLQDIESGQIVELDGITGKSTVYLPFMGKFQALNAVLAAALAISAGIDHKSVVSGLEKLKSPKGRLELVGKRKNGALVFVDYAHNPESIKTVLETLRTITNKRLIIVFGCGGNRDKRKRPLMGELAEILADVVIVTDDNPRYEDAQLIRKEVLRSAPNAIEIADRAQAIQHAVQMLSSGDILVIAGKGHELFQLNNSSTVPFSDHDIAKHAIEQCDKNEFF